MGELGKLAGGDLEIEKKKEKREKIHGQGQYCGACQGKQCVWGSRRKYRRHT